MSAPQVGEILAGKYRVEKVLGQGGMGVVVQAMHQQLDERVAVKFLLPEYAQHPEASTRFLREARAAVKIKSEHVARVIDVGTLETGAPFMVMEYLQGRDLSEVLSSKSKLPPEEAVEYVLQACEAIAEAHAAGIVHRDLKPANLFLTQRADGSQIIKVLDFGISKVTRTGESGPDMSLTKTSTMMGSPLYMSPEQMRSSRDVDARSDLWSIGAILYETLSGRTPFEGESLPELCAKILTDEPAPLTTVAPEIAPELDTAVRKCLAKNADDRYPSVAELAMALVPFGPKRSRTSAERVSRVMSAAGLSTSNLEIGAINTEAPPAPGAKTNAAWGQTGTRPSEEGGRRLIVVATAAVFLLLAGGVGVAAVLRGSGDETTPTAETPAEEPPAAAAAPAPSVETPAAEPVVEAPAPAESATADDEEAEEAEEEPAPSAAPAVTVAPKPAPKPRVVRRVAPKPAPRPAPKAAPPPAPKPAPAPAPKKKSGIDNRALLFGDRK
jgi:serine/threonine-protein kinase